MFDLYSKAVCIVAEQARTVFSKGIDNKIMILLDLAFQVAHAHFPVTLKAKGMLFDAKNLL